jgi:hypothetical protein
MLSGTTRFSSSQGIHFLFEAALVFTLLRLSLVFLRSWGGRYAACVSAEVGERTHGILRADLVGAIFKQRNSRTGLVVSGYVF